jgi:hypothetical protein
MVHVRNLFKSFFKLFSIDNHAVHHVVEVRDIIEATGAILLFLPPYSPELDQPNSGCIFHCETIHSRK